MEGRGWLWGQLILAWLPMWVLFALLIHLAHGTPIGSAVIGGLRMVVPGALLGIAVHRYTRRTPWPHPFRFRFLLAHLVAASLYAVAWLALVSTVDTLITGHLVLNIGTTIGPFLVTGVWLYAMVAAVAYANSAARRAAELEAGAARMQLSELRAQLHPHFLFNALHTVVQLIPSDPRAATRAAEQLATSLRGVLEEQRDLIPLAEELSFAERYLALEQLRFGERLRVRIEVDASLRDLLVPTFAVQTLVENAVRHGAAPKVEATTLTVAARREGGRFCIEVSDDGVGVDPAALGSSSGTGLRRLRERLAWLYGDAARLALESGPGQGLRAKLWLPLRDEAVE